MCLPPLTHPRSAQQPREQERTSSSENEELVFSSDGEKSPADNILENSTSPHRKAVDSLESRLSGLIQKQNKATRSEQSEDKNNLVDTKVTSVDHHNHLASGVDIRKDLLHLSSVHEETRKLTTSRKGDVNLDSTIEAHIPQPPSSSSKSKNRIKGDISIENLKEVLAKPAITSTSRSRDTMLESLRETFGRPTASTRHSGKKEFTLESLSTSEARAMSGLLRQASLEKIGSSHIGNFVASSSKTRLSSNYPISAAGVPDGRITTPEGRLVVSYCSH